MSKNIDEKSLSIKDDNTDKTNSRDENDYTFGALSFFTYPGLNQHLRTCLRKMRKAVVTGSHPTG